MMGDPQRYLFDFPARGRPAPFAIPEQWYPGVRDFWESSTSSRIFDPILGIKAVVIHATAGASSEGAMSVMKGGNASWHWLVPDENEEAHGNIVWACAPEARAALHVRNSKSHPRVNGGATRVNHWSLGIEIVNTQIGTTDSFSDWQIEVTARIVRYCWAKYPNIETVVSHAVLDPERRSDPGTHFNWQKFKDLVLSQAVIEVSPQLVSGVVPMSKLRESKLPSCCAGHGL